MSYDTDDEREALAELIWTKSIQFSNPHTDRVLRWDDVPTSAARQSARFTADAIVAAGFRRKGPTTDEWEYGLLNPNAPDGGRLQGGAHLISDDREHIERQHRRGHPAIQFVRRRKAGPWGPVEAARDAS